MYKKLCNLCYLHFVLMVGQMYSHHHYLLYWFKSVSSLNPIEKLSYFVVLCLTR